MCIKNKEYYINVYNKLIEEDKLEYIKKHGTNNGWDSSSIDITINTSKDYKSINRADQVVGLYLTWYGEYALNVWLSNQLLNEPWISEDCDKKILKILQELFLEVTS